MYQTIWCFVEALVHSNRKRKTIFLLSSSIVFAILGLLVWFVAHFFVLDDITWMLCFMGYPAMFLGYLGGVLYLWNKGD